MRRPAGRLRQARAARRACLPRAAGGIRCVPPRSAARSRIVTMPSPRRARGPVHAGAVILDIQLEQAVSRSADGPTPVSLPSGARRCSALPAARDRHECHGAVDGTDGAGSLVGHGDAGLPFDGRQVPIERALEPSLVENRRDAASATARGRCRACVCAISETSRSSARSGESSGACLPARPSIDPMAVRICPNSSWSSRARLTKRRLARRDELLREHRGVRSESEASLANSRRFDRIR